MRTKDLRKNHQTEDRQGLRVSKGAAGGEWSVEVEVVVVFGGLGGGYRKKEHGATSVLGSQSRLI